MQPDVTDKVGYVVKRYPRFSETFIVNEIRAHEDAGLDIEIFALGFPAETHFQESIAAVRAPVNYVLAETLKAAELWSELCLAAGPVPQWWEIASEAGREDVRQVYQALRIARCARERGISHLHAHFATAATSVARLAARFAGISYSVTAHAKDIFHESVDRRDLHRKLTDAAAVITVSDFNREYLSREYGARQSLHRVYNGLHLDRFSYSSPESRVPVILGIGRLVEKKGFADLVEACAHLRERGVMYECRIIGAGECQADLQEWISRLRLSEHVRLLGPRPQAEVIAQLRESAVLAAPCIVGEDGNRDGLPTVLLEAMALGTPCVATDVTGIPEILDDGVTGLMVPQRHPIALAHALERLLNEPDLRVRLSERARERIERDFDARRNAAQIREIFREARRGRLVLAEVA